MEKMAFKADGTLPGCIGLCKQTWPNRCKECRKHADVSCRDVKAAKK